MESNNIQNMTLYFSVNKLPVGIAYATVTVTLDSSKSTSSLFWRRVYHIPANKTVSIDENTPYLYAATPTGASGALNWGPIPKGVTNPDQTNYPTSIQYDARLIADAPPMGNGGAGLLKGKGIHIESDYPIAAYTHTYGSVASGATMLLPVNSLGIKYTTINSAQNGYQPYDNSYFCIIATKDNTPIKITPSQMGRYGTPAGVPIYITLHKGYIYQYLGKTDATTFIGVELTNSIIESLDSTKPIAVFAGSSRTGGESLICGVSSKDNDFQQCYPQETWGTTFATVPFSTSNGTTIYPNLFAGTTYKVIARDSGTIININGLGSINLLQGTFYKFSNKLFNLINANKPIMVAQFMSSGNCGTGDGDPEMIYLSPIDRGITQTTIYRTTTEGIATNYVSLVVPTNGLSSLKFDSVLATALTNKYITPHPFLPNYSVVIKGWSALKTQSLISCDEPIVGITYGLGAAESYGYNIGANFFIPTPNINPNAKPTIKGVVYVDMNSNGMYDSTEFTRPNVKIQLSNGTYTFSDANGNYELQADSIGTYNATTVAPNLFVPTPANTSYTFTKNDTTFTTNIALQPTVIKDSLQINVIPFYMNAIIGGSFPYYVEYDNVGSTALNTVVNLDYNNYMLMYDSCTDVSATPTATGIVAGATNFKPGEHRGFIPYFTIKSSTNVGDTLKTNYGINGGTANIADSFYMLIEAGSDTPIVQRATRAISPTQINNGKYIEYTINFRNTNTYTLNDLRITDALSNLLDANSVQMVSSSHNCKATIKNGKILFELLNIKLPAFATNKFKSFGYIKFKIKAKASVAIGDVILNTATMYFDHFNAYNTNTVTTIVNATGILPVKLANYNVFLQKENKVLNTWKTLAEINVAKYNVQRSTNGKEFETAGAVAAKGIGAYTFVDLLTTNYLLPTTIYYRLQIVDKDGAITYSEVKTLNFKPQTLNSISLYPNPAKNNFTVEGFDIKQVEVFDYLGRSIQQKNASINNVNNLQTLSFSVLNKGIYFVQITMANQQKQIKKLIVE
jgi:IgGFc binding protein/Secretion system C-terminal sorting domain